MYASLNGGEFLSIHYFEDSSEPEPASTHNFQCI